MKDPSYETVEEALLEHEHIEELGDDWYAGYMGEQIQALVTGVDEYDFSIQVEDIDLNFAWGIVEMRSGVYQSEFDVSHEVSDSLVITIEVTRFPDR